MSLKFDSHNSTSPPSTKALSLLRSSLSNPYPPNKSSAPLDFKLDVVESAPTPDQLKTILSYVSPNGSSPAAGVFLSAHPSAPASGEQPDSLSGISGLGGKNPNAFEWPIVVDWDNGKASIGDVEGVKDILERLRKKRDGEAES